MTAPSTTTPAILRTAPSILFDGAAVSWLTQVSRVELAGGLGRRRELPPTLCGRAITSIGKQPTTVLTGASETSTTQRFDSDTACVHIAAGDTQRVRPRTYNVRLSTGGS